MLEPLRHRGPDGEGITTIGPCTFIHARLGIIDLPLGEQPMIATEWTGQERLSVVFNGMIYNHRQLRRELEGYGHEFKTDHSDTEVLLHGYRQWGADLPVHLNGFFAFAIWQHHQQQLFLCRDRMGKKPLYVHHTPKQLTFSSLIGSLLAEREVRQNVSIDPKVLVRFLQLGYTFDESLLKNVRQIPAGHWMTVHRNGNTNWGTYWQAPTWDPLAQASVGSVRELIEEAVRSRLDSDVPLGCFLSGGIDSSVVAALAQRERRGQGGEPLNTFSVVMPKANFSGAGDYDESAAARQVAEHIGSRHTELVAVPDGAESDTLADLDDLIAIMGEPTADSSLLPTYWVSRAARQHVKVALTGDGGDELFGGYDRYRAMALLQRHRWWLRMLPKDLLRPCPRNHPRSLGTRLHRLLDAASYATPPSQYRSIMHLFTDEQILQLGIELPSECKGSWPISDWPDQTDAALAAMRWDLGHYLAHDLLRKVDRASMAVSLEVRCPLLDRSVVELTSRLSRQQLQLNRQPKAILRYIARELVPASIVERPKQGFAIPIGHWFRHELKAPLAERLFDGTLDGLGIRRAFVERLYQEHRGKRRVQVDHTHRLFSLLTLSMWQRWINAEKHV